jgi:hypothetical protein
MSQHRLTTLLATLFVVGAPAASHAQTTRPAVSLSAGAFQYDLAGTGTSSMLAARAELPLSRIFLLEGGVVYARPTQQFGPATSTSCPGCTTTAFFVPELQLQVQAPLGGGRVAPYLGLGGGGAFDLRGATYGGSYNTYTASAATGVRTWLSDNFGLRGELRVRGIGRSFGGSAAEWTLGMAWRL